MSKPATLTISTFRGALDPSHDFGDVGDPWDRSTWSFICTGCGGLVVVAREIAKPVGETIVYVEGFLRNGLTCDESKLLNRYAKGDSLSLVEMRALTVAMGRRKD